MPKELSELNYERMTAEEKIRWHVLNDCTCGYLPESEYIIPAGHYSNCPMHNPDCDAWNYIYWYDYVPR